MVKMNKEQIINCFKKNILREDPKSGAIKNLCIGIDCGLGNCPIVKKCDELLHSRYGSVTRKDYIIDRNKAVVEYLNTIRNLEQW